MATQTIKELIAEMQNIRRTQATIRHIQELIIYRRTGIPPIARQIHASHERRRLANPRIRRSF